MRGAPSSPLAALRDDRGGMTAWMLLWVVGIMALGGVAVDTSKAWRMKTMLRAAADASSHAAIQAAVVGDDPVAAARRYAELNMPAEYLGEVLRAVDVEMGAWDPYGGGFVADEASSEAVRVTVRRGTRNDNPEPTTLLNIVGVRTWDLSMQSVASTYDAFLNDPDLGDTCLTKGIVARGTVGVTSNNTFSDVCVHGEEGFTFNNNNVYEPEAQISMPDLATQLNHGQPFNAKQNPGIYDVLIEQSIDPVLVDKVDALTLYFARGAEVMAIESYDPSLLLDGDHLYVHCAAPGTLTMPTGRIQDLILTTNCALEFSGGGVFVNSVIATTMDAGADTLAFAALVEAAGISVSLGGALTLEGGLLDALVEEQDAVTGSSEVSLGEEDACTLGGGTLLAADGNINFAAKTGIYGSTLIASGDISMSGQTAGIEGMAIHAGGDVDLPAQQTFIGCNGTDWRIVVKQKVRFLN